MKRSFSSDRRTSGLVIAGSALIAATYGLVRLAYGLFLPDVQAELPFGATAAGLISSAASIVYCLGAVVGFFAGERHPRRLVVAAALSASAGAAGMAAATHAGNFAAFAIVSSAGAGLASPGLVSIVRRNVSVGAVGRSQSVVNAGTGPGLVAAGLLALLLLPDWRLAWSGVAVFTLVVAAAVLVLDRGEVGDRPIGGRPTVPPASWVKAHQLPVVAALLMGAGSAAGWNYGRSQLVAAGASEWTSVAAWVALGLGGAVVMATARRLGRLHPRTAWVLTTSVVAAASAGLGLGAGSTLLALVACAAFGWGYTAGTGALIAWTTNLDADRSPAGTSLLFVILVLGQALGATVTGVLVASAGFRVAFLAAGTVALVAAVVPLLTGNAVDDRRPSRASAGPRP